MFAMAGVSQVSGQMVNRLPHNISASQSPESHTMKTLLFGTLGALLPFTFVGSTAAATSQDAPIPLRVLYVGSGNGTIRVVLPGVTAEDRKIKDMARAAAFREFLSSQFTSVETCTAAEFTAERAQAAEVLVLDEKLPAAAARAFTRPAVTIGTEGVRNSILRGSKFDWMCACLDNRLHNLRSDHAIFRGPRPVSPTLIDEIDLETQRPVRSWTVHSPMKSQLLPGLVVSGENLLEAEDSEIISGGVSGKGDHGIALAREANIFHWGPAGDPRNMTEEARRVLVNTIVYMKQFDGAVQTVRRGVKHRDSAMGAIDSPDFTPQLLPEWVPDDVLKQTGSDQAKLKAIYEGNEGFTWVPPGTSALSLDEDVRALGIPNNDLRLLEKCISQLGDESASARARRVLTRYTGLAFDGQAEWNAWLKANREKLYFSESYGYRFFTGPAGPGPTQDYVRNVVAALVQPNTTDVAPVSVAAGFATAKDLPYVGIGDRMTLVVRIRIRDGWHAYASVPEGNPMIPTQLDVKLPTGLRWAGEWRMTPIPTSGDKDKKGGAIEQQGDVLFVRSLYLAGMPQHEAGKISVRGELQFQACNELRCLPPAALPIEAQVNFR